MKRVLYLSILAVAVLFFASCEKEQPTNPSNEPLPIFRGYMQFSTDVSTRATLNTNMRGKSFGVLGYQYSTTTNWDAAKALATPVVFYDQLVNCSAENGVCSYDPIKPWQDYKYSFFSYYPYGGAGITLSTEGTVGTPTIDYEYAWLSTANAGETIDVYDDPRIFDLMTAEAIDEDGSTNVNLDFKHRMFAIEVLANNYNENLYEYEQVPVWVVDANGDYVLDANGNKIQSTDQDKNPIFEEVVKTDENGNPIFAEDVYKTDENGEFELDDQGNKILERKSNARQIISDLRLSIKGLKHKGMKFPISMQEGEKGPEYIEGTFPVVPNNPDIDYVKFQLSNRPVTIPAFNEEFTDEDGTVRGKGVASSISKLGSAERMGYVMLIPQSHELEFIVTWDEASQFNNYENRVTSTMNFEPGKLYQIIINFVGSGITIAIIEAGSWDIETVYHTFE